MVPARARKDTTERERKTNANYSSRKKVKNLIFNLLTRNPEIKNSFVAQSTPPRTIQKGKENEQFLRYMRGGLPPPRPSR
ncbi:MAG: hypothetical protein K0S31_2378 [Sphingobacterium multivorum]|nr:hypothetical protein [Sphingobacterium multivorum]